MPESIRVLIIDDSPDDQLLYRRALSKGAEIIFDIVGVANGDDGLERMVDTKPDCVLLDYSLPGRNGIEVLKRLRAQHPFLPVAMLTGQGNETVAVAAMQEGAQNYISKSSITPETLQRAVCVSIEHCAMQKRIFQQHATLEAEINVRRHAEKEAQAQLERLRLLQQITRTVSERQDLDGIFQVVARSLEERLPVDLACLLLYDRTDKTLSVARIGIKNEALARKYDGAAGRQPLVDAHLLRAAAGELVSVPNVAPDTSPLARELVDAGLKSLILAPLEADGEVFAVLAVARNDAHAFDEIEREFLRQLSEHVALAGHQARLYTALQDAYDKLQQTQQAVMQQERLRAVGQMASGIAHDINNALSPVMLYTHSLLETETLSTRARDFLETMQRAVEDVTHTIARLRDFYRQREPQLTLLPMDLNTLARQVIDLTRARWSDMSLQRGVVIKVVTDLAPDLPAVLGIEAETREALVNLILNAVDAMPEGGTVTLKTGVLRGPDGQIKQVRVDVNDTGLGMSEETRRRCLEPFYTTKGERGTGLGLAMVYGVAQRQGAEIDIASKLGTGTMVSLVFPSTSVADTSTTRQEAPTAPLAKQKLLLIDDDTMVLTALKTALSLDGHDIVTAEGGQAGIDAFTEATKRGERFSAIITDLGMPHVDGRKVAAAVKGLSPKTPVILLTGWGQGAVATDDDSPAIDAVLGKPARVKDLRATLARLVGEPTAKAS
jgi:signal transduction histidine kinase/DNA-binding NarL/FixJ family response regulator